VQPDLSASLRSFFDRYRDAFDALDPNAIAELYAEPSGIQSGEHYLHWSSRAELCENMRGLCAHYTARGYQSASYEVVALRELGDFAVFADVYWQIEASGDAPGWSFRTAYNLSLAPSGWRVRLCTAYEEIPLA